MQRVKRAAQGKGGPTTPASSSNDDFEFGAETSLFDEAPLTRAPSSPAVARARITALLNDLVNRGPYVMRHCEAGFWAERVGEADEVSGLACLQVQHGWA